MSFVQRRMFSLLPALGVTLLATSSVRAEQTPEIEYVATGACPDASAFLSLVRAHAGERWLAHPTRQAPRFAVAVEDGPAGAIGRLRRLDAGPPAIREVVGGNCQEVAKALALTAALSLAEAPPPGPSIAVRVSGESTSERPRPGATQREWAFGAGVGAWAMLPPRPMAAGLLSASHRVRPGRAGFQAGVLELRLGAFHGRSHLLAAPGKAEFKLSGAGLDLCPVGAGGQRLAVRLCATGQLGVLSGSGIDVAQPRAVDSLWAAGGLLARAGVRVGARVVLELDAGATVPARRTDFVFERPRIAVATVPRVIPQLSVMAMVTIP